MFYYLKLFVIAEKYLREDFLQKIETIFADG